MKKNKPVCPIHGKPHWTESVPPGNGYCRQCIKEEYENAPVCPYCGTKAGFAWGTGDCGCEPDYERGLK